MQVSEGQEITVVLSVTNSGDADANNVTPEIGISGSGSISVVSEPTPTNIAGSGSGYFTWIYSAVSSGNVVFTASATGIDENSGGVVSTGIKTSGSVAIQRPVILSGSMVAYPVVVGEWNYVTVVLMVSNSGEALAVNVTPTGMNNTGDATGLLTGPEPGSVNIAGGGTGYFTWTWTPSGIGSAVFTVRAAGYDVNSGQVIYSAQNITSNAVEVKLDAPDLVSWVIVSPNVINEEQRYTIRLCVSNTGIKEATSVNGEEQGPGNVIGDKIVEPESVTIPAGGYGEFTWVYEAGVGAAGPVNVTIRAVCAEVVGLSADATDGTNSIQALTRPQLAQDIIVSPQVVSVGQRITIRMNVTNSGGSIAEGVVPDALIKIGDGEYTYISGPIPASQDIPAGGNRWFTWTYSAGGAGDIGVNGGVRGYAQYSKVTVTSEDSNSNTITIEGPANLIASIYMPTTRNIGQWFTVTMVVTNTGNAEAKAVSPTTLTFAGTGGVIKISGPVPAGADIAGNNGVQVYQWTYSASGEGSVTLQGSASGYDENSDAIINSNEATSNVMQVQRPAQISSNVWAQPGLVGTGYNITVKMSVTNTGGATANNVQVIEMNVVEVSGGGASLISGDIPTSGVTLEGGEGAYYEWVYRADSAGTIRFEGRAAGTDVNYGYNVTGTAVASNNEEIIEAAALSVEDITISPAVASVGQQVTVIMEVSNTGGGSAGSVAGTITSVQGTGEITIVSGPVPVSQVVAGHNAGAITWIYSATSAGIVSVSGRASGIDSGLGTPIVSGIEGSNVITIESAAALAGDIAVYPGQVSEGQEITVVLSVTNSGDADANNVTPEIGISGSGSISVVSEPTPTNIAGSGSG